MTDAAFPDTPRVDAHDKVRGATRYGADNSRPDMLFGMLAVSTIARGRIVTMDTAAARSLPGVRLLLTHEDLAGLKSAGFMFHEGYAFQSFLPMLSPVIAYRGQPIALVVADTLEIATEAAALVRATYLAEPFNVTFNAPASDFIAQAQSPLPKAMFEDRLVGDADKAFAGAPVKVDSSFATAPEHQNPIELLATVAEWRGGTLIIHEGTQNTAALRHGLAQVLGTNADKIQIEAPYTGGGFGQKNSLQMQTPLAAEAARRLQRPVKLVVTRAQVFHDASFRPASRHRIRLGADRSGKIVAAIHETDSQTSRHDLFPTLYTDVSARLHGIENFRGRETLVQMDTQTPGFMRGPWEHVSCFAFESAVDELAHALNQDPVALRLANDTKLDPLTKLPLSSRHVAECLQRGAEKFGWSRRSMAPGSMRADDGSQIGWGVAIGAYPGTIVPANGRLKITDDGSIIIAAGGHEMGQGIRTALTAVVARKLGVPPESVITETGDSPTLPQHLTAGAWGTASSVPAASDAADAMLRALSELMPKSPAGNTPAQILKAAGRSSLEVEIKRKAPGQPDQVFGRLTEGQLAFGGPVFPEFVTFSYIAHFVEVRVEPGTRRIRIPRVVSVADCGRVMNPRTARSQVQGGVVWGIGAAMREESEVDPRFGGFLNADLAEYALPVNADIGSIEVDFIDKPDMTFNNVGVKGLGEVAITGVAPAIANAVYHATGSRLRNLPIRIEHVL